MNATATKTEGPTLDWQRKLVAGVTTGMTVEQVNAIADMCMAARERGDNSSVWHQVAAYFRNGENCNCALCQRATGLKPRHVPVQS